MTHEVIHGDKVSLTADAAFVPPPTPDYLIRSYLFMGKPGTKKTLTLQTFKPDWWTEELPPWAYIFACDRKKEGGMAVLRGIPGIEYDVYVDAHPRRMVSVRKPAGGGLTEPKAIDKFVTKFNVVDTLEPFPYYMMALDTISGLITGLYDEMFFKLRAQNPDASKELLARVRPSQGEIGDAQWYVMDYVKAFLQLPCITVVVAHTAFDKDSDGTRRMYPKLPGQAINDDFLSLFDEVYHFEQGPATTEIMARTEGSLSIPARTSQPALDAFEPLDFQVWASKMKGYYDPEGGEDGRNGKTTGK